MCKNTNLSKTEWGFVVRCKSCGYYHVAFGTTVLKFTEESFIEFTFLTERYLLEYADACNKMSKMISIETDSKNIGLIYSYNELERLCNLLKEAREVLKREKLFSFSLN